MNRPWIIEHRAPGSRHWVWDGAHETRAIAEDVMRQLEERTMLGLIWRVRHDSISRDDAA